MITDEQLTKIERHAHPKTREGKMVLRLAEELREGARHYGHLQQRYDDARAYLDALERALERIGYQVERATEDLGEGLREIVRVTPIEEARAGKAAEDGAP